MIEITSDPAIMGGVPVFKGTRIPVSLVVAMLQQGALDRELLENYPTLTQEMIDAARDQ